MGQGEGMHVEVVEREMRWGKQGELLIDAVHVRGMQIQIRCASRRSRTLSITACNHDVVSLHDMLHHTLLFPYCCLIPY